MKRVTIIVAVEEEWEYKYGETSETRVRDREIYKQIIEVSDEPNNSVRGIVTEISKVLNK